MLSPKRQALTSASLRRRRALPSVLFVGVLILSFGLWVSLVRRLNAPGWIHHHNVQRLRNSNLQEHPIDYLMRDANSRFENILSKRSLTLKEAAARYRERRGRHPPPGFDKWFAQAREDEAIVVEEFFDRIHHDINPFWAMDPAEMRARADAHIKVIRVRNGHVNFDTDGPTPLPRGELWTDLVTEMMPHLPDMDIALNHMDETRVLVPWEKLRTYVNAERASRKLIHPRSATSTYSGVQGMNRSKELQNLVWITDEAPRYWDHLRYSCSPQDPSRNVPALTSFDGPVQYPKDPLPYMYQGFIQNWTQARDSCLQPHLRGMHGTFVESVSMSTTHSLVPLFGCSKLLQNNDILLPGAMYLSDREFYNGGKGHGPPWADKQSGLIWRGTASGGRNKENNWWHFHRHRWVQMMNATVLAEMERYDSPDARTFSLVPAVRNSVDNITDLLSFSDVGFVDLECAENPEQEDILTCPHTSPYFALLESMPMKEQYKRKFLPDLDGNSFSGRWRAFMQSTSLPMKATIYSEWHDDRLMPWVHFVPFDNSFRDIYALLDYFVKNDLKAEVIATHGKTWADKVLRREDMKLYVWRLLLEYARVGDDNRQNLAFVGDLVA